MSTLPTNVPYLGGSNWSSAIWLEAYKAVLGVTDTGAILKQVCARVAAALALPLVSITRRLDSGVVSLQAWSRENELWLDLQRLPERWDGTVVGDGPAARALQSQGPVAMTADEDGFMPWRKAAAAEGVRSAAAVPFVACGQQWLLQLYSADRQAFASPTWSATPLELAGELVLFLEAQRQRQTEKLLAAAISRSGTAAFIADLEGTIVWCNSAFTALSGYPEDAVLGKNPKMLQSGQHGLRYYRELWNTLRSGQTWTAETVERDAEGRLYTVQQTVTPFGTGERISHYLALHQDISARKEDERRLERNLLRDPLTGLSTRSGFDAALLAACEQAQGFGLALISIPNIGHVVETLGAEGRDLLLEEAGQRIRSRLEAPSIACRVNDREFLLLLTDRSRSQCEQLLGEMRSLLTSPYPLVGDAVTLEYRQALVMFDAPGDAPDALLRRLDRQLADQPQSPARRLSRVH